MNTPPAPLADADFRRIFKLCARGGGSLAVSVVLICYATCLLKRPGAENQPRPAAVAAPAPFDWYVLRDVSASVNPSKYDKLEEDIRGRLCFTSGERVSRAYFGSDTEPVGSPKTGLVGAPEAMYGALPGSHPSEALRNTTNFALLFDRIRQAIKGEREACTRTRTEHHADTVVIISDGIPDVGNRHLPIPRESSSFINQDIVNSFEQLVTLTNYNTIETVRVRLLLWGVKGGFSPVDIKQAWENRILRALDDGRAGQDDPTDCFAAIYAPTLGQLADELFASLSRRARQSMTLMPLKDKERRNLDRRTSFSVQFEATSHIKGDRFQIKTAELRDVTDSSSAIKLHVMRDQNLDPPPADATNLMLIDVPDPPAGSLSGKPIRGSIYLSLIDSKWAPISEESRVRLFLNGSKSLIHNGCPAPNSRDSTIQTRCSYGSQLILAFLA